MKKRWSCGAKSRFPTSGVEKNMRGPLREMARGRDRGNAPPEPADQALLEQEGVREKPETADRYASTTAARIPTIQLCCDRFNRFKFSI